MRHYQDENINTPGDYERTSPMENLINIIINKHNVEKWSKKIFKAWLAIFKYYT